MSPFLDLVAIHTTFLEGALKSEPEMAGTLSPPPNDWLDPFLTMFLLKGDDMTPFGMFRLCNLASQCGTTSSV